MLNTFYPTPLKEVISSWFIQCGPSLPVHTVSLNGYICKYIEIVLYFVRDIKPPTLFPPIFSSNYSQLEQLKKKTNFSLVRNRFFFSFGPMKSLLSFSTGQTEQILWKQLGKIRLVIWWFDGMNKIIEFWLSTRLDIFVGSCCLLDYLEL